MPCHSQMGLLRLLRRRVSRSRRLHGIQQRQDRQYSCNPRLRRRWPTALLRGRNSTACLPGVNDYHHRYQRDWRLRFSLRQQHRLRCGSSTVCNRGTRSRRHLRGRHQVHLRSHLRLLEQNLPGRKRQDPMGSAILLLLPLRLVRQQRYYFCHQLHPSCRRQHDLDLFPLLPALTQGNTHSGKGAAFLGCPFLFPSDKLQRSGCSQGDGSCRWAEYFSTQTHTVPTAALGQQAL
jgi:hypothetical protein